MRDLSHSARIPTALPASALHYACTSGILVVVALVVAACGGQASATPGALPTPRLERATTAPLPPSAIPPSPTPLLGGPPATDTSPTSEPCTSNSEFVTDLTVPDETEFRAGEAIDKRWEVRNSGTCAWGAGFRLVLVDGNPMGAPTEMALYPAAADTTATVQVNMIAPNEAGDYIGAWQMRDPDRQLFGDRMWIRIKVIGATPTP